MTDIIGAIIAVILILFITSPLLLAIYMLGNLKIDVDRDGKNDAQMIMRPADMWGAKPNYVKMQNTLELVRLITKLNS